MFIITYHAGLSMSGRESGPAAYPGVRKDCESAGRSVILGPSANSGINKEKIMKRFAFFIIIFQFVMNASAETSGPGDILSRYVRDFRKDPASAGLELCFGVRVAGRGIWTVRVSGEDVTLREGSPSEPAFIYITDLETLRRIDSGELSVITAMGKASMSDPAPMDFKIMEGYRPPEDFMAFFAPFTFHFWTRGFPETVMFGKEHTRMVHGANVTAFYYQEGFRSAWYRIEKGQHINERSDDQVNPFPTLAVFTSGEAEARIGGKYLKIGEGTSVFIPAGTAHEFWNESKEPAEFIILMFGEGA
jgi:mannose-6-phosphate isomerase-like protein (cupin superfamily)